MSLVLEVLNRLTAIKRATADVIAFLALENRPEIRFRHHQTYKRLEAERVRLEVTLLDLTTQTEPF